MAVRYVNADPAAAELVGGVDGRAAAAEGVKDDVAGVGGGVDDALQERQRLLSGVAKTLLGLGVDGRDIVPGISDGDPRHLVKVSLIPGDSAGTRLDDAPLGQESLHLVARIAPVPRHPEKLILWMAPASRPWSRHIPQPITTPFRIGVGVLRRQVVLSIASELLIESGIAVNVSAIVQQKISDPRPVGSALPVVPFGRSTSPTNLILEVVWSEYRIHKHLQVMARCRIAVEVNAAGVLQRSVQLHQAHSHHGKVGGHVVVAQAVHHGPEHARHVLVGPAHGLLVGPGRGRAPVPGILKRLDLGTAGSTGGLAEEDVVGRLAVEGRVQVDEVYRLVGEVLPPPQDVQVIAVVENVGLHHGEILLHIWTGLNDKASWRVD